MILIFIIILGIALIAYVISTTFKCFYEKREIVEQESCENMLVNKNLNTQRFFVINLIVQATMFLLSLLYSFTIATGWDELTFIAMFILSAPSILIDTIGIIYYYIKHKIKNKKRYGFEAKKETAENKSGTRTIMSEIFKVLLVVAIMAYTLFVFLLFILEIIGKF